jgi:hypothetical protein
MDLGDLILKIYKTRTSEEAILIKSCKFAQSKFNFQL